MADSTESTPTDAPQGNDAGTAHFTIEPGKTQQQAEDGATPPADEPLGEPGKTALLKERDTRKAAEKRASEAEARLRELEDAGKTEAQKQADALKRAEAELESIRAEKQRLEVASSSGVPADLLAGPGDDLDAYAAALLEWRGSVKQEAPRAAMSGPVPTIGKVPERTGAITIDEQIAAAEQAGEKSLVASLKAMKLGAIARQQH